MGQNSTNLFSGALFLLLFCFVFSSVVVSSLFVIVRKLCESILIFFSLLSISFFFFFFFFFFFISPHTQVQILLDPYYRTIQGFQVVVSKEWLKAGHRMHIRTGHGEDNPDDTNRSPIFTQFLDCVYQLLCQFPLDFEFNERLLLDTVDSLYSGRFGTFLYNNERERREQDLPNKSTSFWDYVDARRRR